MIQSSRRHIMTVNRPSQKKKKTAKRRLSFTQPLNKVRRYGGDQSYGVLREKLHFNLTLNIRTAKNHRPLKVPFAPYQDNAPPKPAVPSNSHCTCF